MFFKLIYYFDVDSLLVFSVAHMYDHYPLSEKKRLVYLLYPEEVIITVRSVSIRHSTYRFNVVACIAIALYSNTYI